MFQIFTLIFICINATIAQRRFFNKIALKKKNEKKIIKDKWSEEYVLI